MGNEIMPITKVAVFRSKKIRKTIHNNEWWFSVVDVCEALTDSVDAGAYWRKLKQRLQGEGSEVVTFCHGLKLPAPDGKMRGTDCANTEGIFRIIQSIPSPKAEPFKRWLSRVGYERVQEIDDPELATKRTRALYKAKGYSDDWIEKRMRGIAIREELPDDLGAVGLMWSRPEIENYLCYPEVLEAYAIASGREELPGPLFESAHIDSRRKALQSAVEEVTKAMETLGKGSPWDRDTKVSEDFLTPLFKAFFKNLDLYNIMDKKNFHEVAHFVPKDMIDPEVKEKLDAIVVVAKEARPRED